MHLLASVKLLRARQKQIWFRLLALFKYESAILSFVKTGISMMVFLTAITWLWTLADEQKQRRTATTASSSIFIVIFWIPYLLGPIYRTINWRISKLRAEKVIYRRQIITIRYNVARAQSTTLRNTYSNSKFETVYKEWRKFVTCRSKKKCWFTYLNFLPTAIP